MHWKNKVSSLLWLFYNGNKSFDALLLCIVERSMGTYFATRFRLEECLPAPGVRMESDTSEEYTKISDPVGCPCRAPSHTPETLPPPSPYSGCNNFLLCHSFHLIDGNVSSPCQWQEKEECQKIAANKM